MKMYMAELASMKQPAISRMMFTTSRNRILLPPTMVISVLLAADATPVTVSTQENRLAVPTMNITTAV